jgi:hypothetical protein
MIANSQLSPHYVPRKSDFDAILSLDPRTLPFHMLSTQRDSLERMHRVVETTIAAAKKGQYLAHIARRLVEVDEAIATHNANTRAMIVADQMRHAAMVAQAQRELREHTLHQVEAGGYANGNGTSFLFPEAHPRSNKNQPPAFPPSLIGSPPTSGPGSPLFGDGLQFSPFDGGVWGLP